VTPVTAEHLKYNSGERRTVTNYTAILDDTVINCIKEQKLYKKTFENLKFYFKKLKNLALYSPFLGLQRLSAYPSGTRVTEYLN